MSTQISKQQFDTRWDALPEILREAMASETNSSVVWKTAESEHLSEEKISAVSRSTGYVLMGFIHPEDLANEIKDSTGIDSRIAAAIVEPINTKIFQPLRDELENLYAPPGDESRSPIPIDEIGKPQVAVPVPTPAPVPQVSKAGISPTSVPMPKPVNQPTPFPQSMIQPRQPVKATPPSNLPVLSKVGVPVSETPDIKPIEKVASPIQPIQKESAGQPVSAPFILHQETEFQPTAQTKSNFKVTLSEEQFGKMEQKWMPPPKAAQIETSFVYGEPSRTIPQPKPASPNRVESDPRVDSTSSPRIVHYSEMRTPVAPAPDKIGVSAPSNLSRVASREVEVPAPSKTEVPKPPAKSETTIPKPPVPPAITPAVEYRISRPAQPRFPVSQPEQKMTYQPANPFGISDRNNKAINLSEPKPIPEIPPGV